MPVFLGQIWHVLSSNDTWDILDDIRLHFEKKKKNHQRALSSLNLKTKHKTHDFSTIIASLGAIWVPKEAKFFRKIYFLGLERYFSAKIELTSKNHWKMAVFQRFWPILKFTQFWLLKNRAPNQENWLFWRILLLLVPMLPLNSR